MPDLGRMLVIAGLVIAAVGVALWIAPAVPWLGRLPGDIRIERPGVRIYFPLATCVVLSVAISAVLWLLGRWR
jgi:hypothetical protein